MSLEIAQADSEDVDQAVSLLVEAFASDPQMVFFFPVELEKRSALVREFFTILIEARLGLHMPVLLAKSGNGVSGVVMGYDSTRPEWLPVHSRKFSEFESRHPGLSERLSEADSIMKKCQPDARHYYLGVVGVAPMEQGKGTGTALIRYFLNMSDQDKASNGTFLETANPKNVPYYERLGFGVVGQGPIDQNTTLWCLYRAKP